MKLTLLLLTGLLLIGSVGYGQVNNLYFDTSSTSTYRGTIFIVDSVGWVGTQNYTKVDIAYVSIIWDSLGYIKITNNVMRISFKQKNDEYIPRIFYPHFNMQMFGKTYITPARYDSAIYVRNGRLWKIKPLMELE